MHQNVLIQKKIIIFQNIPYFYFLQSYLSNNQNATERTHHILSKVFLQRYQTLKKPYF